MSFTFSNTTSTFENAVTAASSAGMLLVGAAGNYPTSSGSVRYPAKYPEVIAVSGTTPTNGFAEGYSCMGDPPVSSSAKGSEIELAAPFEAYSLEKDGTYGYRCGTSQAAPHVSGVAALIWSAYPTWSASQVRTRLRSRALDLGSAGKDSKFGYGLVRAYEALRPIVEGAGTLYAGESATYSHGLTPANATYQWQWDTGSGWTNLGTGQNQAVTARMEQAAS